MKVVVNRRRGLSAAVGALVLSVSTASAASSTAPAPTPVAPEPTAAAATLSSTFQEPRTVGLAGNALTSARVVMGDRMQVASTTRTTTLAAGGVDSQEIPFAALYAYETAAAALGKADPACGLEWSLLAAIGRVESDHGRYGGAELGADGVSTPLIRGVALNGKGPVRAIKDTDAGRLDGDRRWDRAVGPMQFLPSTWVYSGVDADGDGVRSPDDLDDAALAAGVYLCSGGGALDTPQGLRTAVLRYNQSGSYADSVIRLARSYAAGKYTSVTAYSPATSAALEPNRVVPPAPTGAHRPARTGSDRPGKKPTKPAPKPEPTKPAKPEPTKPDPMKPDPIEPTEPNGPTEPTEPNGPTEPTDPEPTEPEPTEPEPNGPGEPAEPSVPAEPTGPVLVEMRGVLTDCGAPADEAGEQVPPTEFCLEGTPLSLGGRETLARAAMADHDGDGAVETNADELAGLLGTAVTVLVEEGTTLVRAVNGAGYAAPLPN